MSLTKETLDDIARVVAERAMEYGEVDPPYYEDMWPSEEELKADERFDFNQ